jgi:putative membrane protein
MRAINVRRLSATVTTTLFAMVTTLLLPAAVFAQERPYDWGWGMHPMGWMGGMWGIGMMFMMLLFWFLVIGGLIVAVRWFLSDQKERRGNDSAMEILRQRYARGEINKEEFETKKRDLS